MLADAGRKGHIRAIQEDTGATIDVDDDGTVVVAAMNGDAAKAALARVEACTATAQIGKIYDGTVSSVRDFGAFVEILPGRDGLVHISELSTGYVATVDDICKVGDPMKVIVIDIDEQDRVKLSRRRALEELGIEDEFAGAEECDEPRERPERAPDRGGDRGGRFESRGGGGGGRGPDRGRSGGRSSSGGGGGRGRR